MAFYSDKDCCSGVSRLRRASGVFRTLLIRQASLVRRRVSRGSLSVDEDQFTLKSPCYHRGFLLLQSPQTAPKSAFNTWHHYPQNSQSFHPLSRLIHPQKKQGRANKASAFFNPTSTHISSTQLPNTSLPIAIADAICSSKSHRDLMPVFWNLIKANIKCKG